MTIKQKPPKGDNRYRVHRSARLYVAKLECGTVSCTWYINESVERVVYLGLNGTEKVLYKTDFYELQSPERLKSLVKSQLKSGGGLHIGGKSVSAIDGEITYQAHPFIDISSQADRKQHEKYLRVQGQLRSEQKSK
jgi:hypothetical protein